MPFPLPSQFSSAHRWAVLAILLVLTLANAPAFSTGVPLAFTIDPGTIRQREKDEEPILATVLLKTPSPTFFVCEIRSADPAKVSFATIVFKKGQLKGTAPGIVHWSRIRTDGEIKVSAFSVEAPEEKLWFTVALKVKDEDENGDGAPGAPPPGE